MKILIVKTSAIGDVIQSFEVLEYLRRRFPNAHIDWVVEQKCRDLLEAHPMLTGVLSMDRKFSEALSFLKRLRKVRYDLIVDLQGNIKSGCITALARGMVKLGYGKKSVTEWPNLLVTTRRFDPPEGLNVRQRYLFLVQSYFDDQTSFQSEGVVLGEPEILKDSWIMVAFGSNWPNKQLSLETLVALLERIGGRYIFPYLGTQEQTMAERLLERFPMSKMIGNLTLPRWQSLMASCDAVIAMDSAALHLAGTTKTPTMGLFGPSSAAYYAPTGCAVFQGSCPYDVVFKKRCPRLRTCETGACMKEAQVGGLFKVFKTLTLLNR